MYENYDAESDFSSDLDSSSDADISDAGVMDTDFIEDVSEEIPEDSNENLYDYEGDASEIEELNEDVEYYDENNLTDDAREDMDDIPEDVLYDETSIDFDENIAEEDIEEDVAETKDLEEETIEAVDGTEYATDDAMDIAMESSNISEINSVSDYMNAHNYSQSDFSTYSQDPQWRQLMRQEYPDFELPELTQENARSKLSQYMNEHNYGIKDYETYSQDPIWKELHTRAFPDYDSAAMKNEL